VKDGEVILSGLVIDRADKRLAEDIAESVSGVKNVQNNLRIGEGRQAESAAARTAMARGA
jgi:osmotically-inducible protein OsmY